MLRAFNFETNLVLTRDKYLTFKGPSMDITGMPCVGWGKHQKMTIAVAKVSN